MLCMMMPGGHGICCSHGGKRNRLGNPGSDSADDTAAVTHPAAVRMDWGILAGREAPEPPTRLEPCPSMCKMNATKRM
jgi:hypothetical protein